MSNLPSSSGAALKTLRLVAGLTLDQASALGDTAPAYLSKVERGVLFPTRRYLVKMSRALTDAIANDPSGQLGNKVAV